MPQWALLVRRCFIFFGASLLGASSKEYQQLESQAQVCSVVEWLELGEQVPKERELKTWGQVAELRCGGIGGAFGGRSSLDLFELERSDVWRKK